MVGVFRYMSLEGSYKCRLLFSLDSRMASDSFCLFSEQLGVASLLLSNSSYGSYNSCSSCQLPYDVLSPSGERRGRLLFSAYSVPQYWDQIKFTYINFVRLRQNCFRRLRCKFSSFANKLI